MSSGTPNYDRSATGGRWIRQCCNPPTCVLVLLAAVSHASGQLPQLRLYSVFPPGGCAGTSFQVTVTGGADVDDVDQLRFNDPAIAAVREPVDEADSGGNKLPTFTVTIDKGAAPGIREMRLVGRFGNSNPRGFAVGRRGELQEAEPNDDGQHGQRIALNSVVNARCNKPADVDVYRLHARHGQRVIVTCCAERIDSRMRPIMEAFDGSGRRVARSHQYGESDPILDLRSPKDGDYLLKVFDADYRGGNEFFYRLTVHTGPYIDYVMPPAGPPGSAEQYTVYGRNLPGGEPADVDLDGCPLEKCTAIIPLPKAADHVPAGTYLASYQAAGSGVVYRLESNGQFSNPVTIQFSSTPVALEQEPNDTTAQARQVSVPTEIAGQFQTPGDIDHFRFSAAAKDVLWFEVVSHRAATGADPYLTVDHLLANDQGKPAGTKRIAAVDDQGVDLLPGKFSTSTDDPAYQFVAPSDGAYCVSLRDRYFESRGNARLVYRVVIRREQPDFRLVVVPLAPVIDKNNAAGQPWSVGLRRGGDFALRVLAFRQDGFTGSIDVSADHLPPGVTCRGATLYAGQTQANLVIRAAEDAAITFQTIRVVGKARVPTADGKSNPPSGITEVTHTARPGTMVWSGSQGGPAHARLAADLGLSVMNETAPFQVTGGVTEFDVNRGRQVLVPVTLVRRNGFDADVALLLNGQPKNVQVQPQPIKKGQGESWQRIFVPANAPLGDFTLSAAGQAQVAYQRPSAQLDRAKALQAEAAQAVAAAAKARNMAAARRDSAVAASGASAAALAKAQAAVDGLATDAAPQDAELIHKALAAAQAADESTQAARGMAEKAVAEAEGQYQRALAKKADSEKQLAKAQQAVKPQNLVVVSPMASIALHVRQHPATLTAAVPGGGVIKRGGHLDVPVKVNRVNGFAGPAVLTLPLPPNVNGLTAEPVTIAAEYTEGVLKISAAKDATEGQLANMVIRAKMSFQGEAMVDQPITLKVVK